mmetsp:Transcript_58109/g.114345  ORF Transcript_58109/g.114345 Transcript_58109/m.114345 type:complete len:109 (+) Transcript_58109:1705-2031(+)
MQRTGVANSIVPSRDKVRPRALMGDTSSTRTNDGLASPCAAVGVRLRSLVPNGRDKLKPSLVGVPALLPFMFFCSLLQYYEVSLRNTLLKNSLVENGCLLQLIDGPSK